MKPFTPIATVDQFTNHLRQSIIHGELSGELPGIKRLASAQGVSSNTVIAAIKQLEKDGFIIQRGHGRASSIQLPDSATPLPLRVAILLYEKSDAQRDYLVELRHALSDAGHPAHFCTKSLLDINMDLNRLKRIVLNERADAWIVFAGTKKILNWFSQERIPTFAYGGRRRNVMIAGSGPDKTIGLQQVINKLMGYGHRRIVMIAREERRKPTPALFERTFLEQLESNGISTSSYNLPDWEEGPKGLFECLDRAFRVTPPTAIFIEESHIFLAAQQHLAQQGIMAPRHVSLICGDPDPVFDWCQPSVAHISWDSKALVRHIKNWTDKIARGKDDRRQFSIKSTFVNGSTIGPAPTKSP